jgi:hypothetical protein
MAPPQMTPSLDETQRFLSALDTLQGARFAFAAFDDWRERSDHRLAIRLYGDLNQVVRLTGPKRGQLCSTVGLLSFMQSRGAGVFITVQSVDGGGATAQHVDRIRALIADADSDQQLASLRRFIDCSGLLPSIAVMSGGVTASGADKLQVYWLLRHCPIASFAETQALLLARTGTDPAVKDLARVLRLAGFFHQKREPRLTRIVSISNIVYDLRDFIACVRAQPQVQEMSLPRGNVGGIHRHYIASTAQTGTGDRTARLRVLLENNGGLVKPSVRALLREATAPHDGTPGNRHPTLLAIVARLSQLCWDEKAIRALILLVINTEWDEGPWDAHLDRITAWVRERDNAQRHGLRATTWPEGLADTQGDTP